MPFTTVSTPVVGGKITAAGYGTQVKTSIGELQAYLVGVDSGAGGGTNGLRAELDAIKLRSQADPTQLSAGTLSTGAVTAAAGTTNIVALPGSGVTRVVKSLTIHAPATGMVVQLKVAGNVRASWTFSAAGETGLACTIPFVSTDGGGLDVIVSGGTAQVTATYVDRSDTGLISRADTALTSATAAALVTAGATARTVTQLWLAAPSTATTATVKIGSTTIRNALAMSAGGILVANAPLVIPPSTSLTVASDGTNNLAAIAAYI